MCIFHLGLPAKNCTTVEELAEELAAFGGRPLVLILGLRYSHFLEVHNEMYTHIETANLSICDETFFFEI